MREFWICLLLTGAVVNTLIAQSEATLAPQAATVAEFNTLFRDMDLNADTQKGYSITESEYAVLQIAWKNLSLADRNHLMNGNDSWKDFALMLLVDFLNNTPWEGHVQKAAKFRAKGLSLTSSRYKCNLSLKRARKTLVDFLHKGPHMFVGSELILSEPIKVQAKERAGDKALQRLEKWESLISNHQDQSAWKKLSLVNNFFNHKIKETLDRDAAKGYDYWQSPIETLVRGKGDCDDFAIAKYVSLRLLGIPAERLRVGVVEHTSRGGHGVLFFYPLNESDPWVLDNLISTRLGSSLGTIRRLSAMVNFNEIKPLWGMNENILTEFDDNLSESVSLNDPREVYPAFATALVNSQRLLPQDEKISRTIREILIAEK